MDSRRRNLPLSHAVFQNSLCTDLRTRIQAIVFKGLNNISLYPEQQCWWIISASDTTHNPLSLVQCWRTAAPFAPPVKTTVPSGFAGEECTSAIALPRDPECRELSTGPGSKGQRGGEGERKGRENQLVSREKHPVGCVHLPRLHFTYSTSTLCHSHTGKWYSLWT